MDTDNKFAQIEALTDQILAEAVRLVQAEATADDKTDTAFEVYDILADLENRISEMIQGS
jgi:hypothetical protein